MKRSTVDHPKLKMLMRALDVGKIEAVGILELLWHFTAKFTPAGDIGKYEPQSVADWMGYDGDAEALFGALASSRWLDRTQQTHGERINAYVVHDWFDHADDSVHMGLARSALLFVDGRMPKLSRFSSNEKTRIKESYARHTHGTRTAHALPSPPIPSPALPSPPIPSTTPRKRLAKSDPIPEMPSALDTEAFRSAWKLWQDHRKHKGAKLTPETVRLQFKKLEELGHDRGIEALEHSITQGYTGIFEPGGTQTANGRAGQASAGNRGGARTRRTAADRGEYPEDQSVMARTL